MNTTKPCESTMRSYECYYNDVKTLVSGCGEDIVYIKLLVFLYGINNYSCYFGIIGHGSF